MALEIENPWRDRAACRGPNQTVFYPPAAGEPRREKRWREMRAKQICADCSVQAECLEHAVGVNEQHGIWGGLTPAERKSMAHYRWS